MDDIIQCCKRDWHVKIKKLFQPRYINHITKEGDTLHIVCAKHKASNVLQFLIGFPQSRKLIEVKNNEGMKAIDYILKNKDYQSFLVLRREFRIKLTGSSKDYLKTSTNISMLYLLNNTRKNKTSIFDKIKIKPRITQENKRHIEEIINISKGFKNIYIANIGVASMVVSHYILNITKNYIDDGRNITSENLKKKLRVIKNTSLKKLMKDTYTKLVNYTKNETKLKDFNKSIQWPHIPLAYLNDNKGSCVDFALLKYITFKREGYKIKLTLGQGADTYMSHVDIKKSRYLDVENLDMLFCLFSMYHVFRHLQYIRYMVKNKHVEEKLIRFVYTILDKLIKDKHNKGKLAKFLLDRKTESYKDCIDIIKSVEKKTRMKSITTFGKFTENKIAMSNIEESKRKTLVNNTTRVLRIQNKGYVVYKIVDKKLFRFKKLKKDYIYIIYVKRTNNEYTGLTYDMVKILKNKHNLPIVAEVKSKKTIVSKIHKDIGFIKVGSTRYGNVLLLK